MIEHADTLESVEMIDHAAKMQHQEMTSLGMAFMGFLMGVGAILGIWFLSGMLVVLNKMIV